MTSRSEPFFEAERRAKERAQLLRRQTQQFMEAAGGGDFEATLEAALRETLGDPDHQP